MYFEKLNFKETPNEIIEKLYLGNAADSENFEKLQNLNIKYILIAGNWLSAKFPSVKFK